MFKSTKKLIELEAQVQRLTDLIESEEMKKLRKDSEELKRIQNLLKNVRFKLKDARFVDGEEPVIIVTYELPRITLKLDENGNPNKDDFFYSTNMLNMISLDDMSKFQNILRNAQARVKNIKKNY